METKQVILIRRDLKMRRGKEVAQGAHAAMMWLRSKLIEMELHGAGSYGDRIFHNDFMEGEVDWLTGSMTKVVCQVADLAELESVVAAAKAAGLTAHAVTDEGRTEFGGTPTVTAAAIGPDRADEVDAVCGKLRLY